MAARTATPASRRAQHLRQATPLLIQLWLAAGKDDPLDSQFSDRTQLLFKIRRRDLSRLTNPPDIAHHTAAVALIVWKNYQHRQRAYMVRGLIGRSPGRRDGYEGAHHLVTT